jgi:uncharacterized membrane protein YidH (DUF202 family)
MFGIEDTYVSMAYLLCIASSLLCIIYGLLNWNRGEQATREEDIRWAQEEKHVEEEL